MTPAITEYGKGRRRHYCTHAPMNSRRKILLAFTGMKERRRFPRTFTSFSSTCLFEVFILLVATDMSPNENKRKPLIRSRAWIQTLFVFSNRKRDGITGRCTLVACVWFVSFLWFPSTKIYCCVRKKKKNNWLWSNDVFWGLFSFFFFSFLMLWLFLVDRRANHCRQRQRNCR